MKPMIRRLAAVLLLLIPLAGSAQDDDVKKEYEESVEPTEIPARALELAEPFLQQGRDTRYYREFTEDGEFYEIKLEYKGRRLSIEFHDDGSLYDIEELIDIDELPDKIEDNIEEYFEDTYRRHRITRQQRQYSGDDENEVIRKVLENKPRGLTIKYELEADVIGGEEDRFGPYEFLFDDKGRLENSREIELRATDNVTY